MAHRALVTVERPDGRYDCYRARWGGLTVFERGGAASVVADAVAGSPLERGASVRSVLAALDPPLDEAFLVRDAAGRITTYLVCWLGLQTSVADVASRRAPTALVPVTDSDTARELDCVVRTLKGVLGDAVDAGLLPGWLARGYLVVAVARHPAVAGDAVWFDQGVTADAR